jgi:tetratricopeptide (TPR) repeat protein
MYYSTPEFAYFNLGLAYAGKRDFNKATESFQMAIDLKGQYVDPYVELGLVYQEQGNHSQAVQIFQKARALMEKKEPKKGKTSEAEWNAYRSALAGVCYYQAMSLTKLSRFAEAAESYQKALDVAPDEDMQRRIQRELESLPPR